MLPSTSPSLQDHHLLSCHVIPFASGFPVALPHSSLTSCLLRPGINPGILGPNLPHCRITQIPDSWAKANHQLHGPCSPLSSGIAVPMSHWQGAGTVANTQDFELRVLLGSSSEERNEDYDFVGMGKRGGRQGRCRVPSATLSPHQHPQGPILCLMLPSQAQTQQCLGQHPPHTDVNSSKYHNTETPA